MGINRFFFNIFFMKIKCCKKSFLAIIFYLLAPVILFAQADTAAAAPDGRGLGEIILMILLLATTLFAAAYLAFKTVAVRNKMKSDRTKDTELNLEKFVNSLGSEEIEAYLNYKQMKKTKSGENPPIVALILALMGFLFSPSVFAQAKPAGTSLFTEGGIIITLILILTPILVGIILMIVKVSKLSRRYKLNRNIAEAERLSKYLKTLPPEEVTNILLKRKEVLDYKISQSELSGTLPVADKRGILKNIDERANIRFIEEKRKAIQRPGVDPKL